MPNCLVRRLRAIRLMRALCTVTEDTPDHLSWSCEDVLSCPSSPKLYCGPGPLRWTVLWRHLCGGTTATCDFIKLLVMCVIIFDSGLLRRVDENSKEWEHFAICGRRVEFCAHRPHQLPSCTKCRFYVGFRAMRLRLLIRAELRTHQAPGLE